MSKTVIITGGGSGVGRAVALELAVRGWQTAILGRGEDKLRETVILAGEAGARLMPVSCDISAPADVDRIAATVLQQLGSVFVLVNAAGINVPRRNLDQLSLEDYRKIIDVNLNGLYLCAQAVLPAMRRQKSGTIISINSTAGRRASALSGPAYVAAKFGAAGLIQSINAEENRHGIRACSIFPGDINTPLLDRRPSPPPPEARRRMLQPEDVAACVMLAIDLPARALVEELLIHPGGGDLG